MIRATCTCSMCGGKGHRRTTCPEDPRNTNRRIRPCVRDVHVVAETTPTVRMRTVEEPQIPSHSLTTFSLLSEQETQAKEAMRQLAEDLVSKVAFAMSKVAEK